jgi:hypothetical protein
MFSLILSLFCVATVDAGSNCCDGTYSSSEGRGTCSYHGGVCETMFDLYLDSSDEQWELSISQAKLQAESDCVQGISCDYDIIGRARRIYDCNFRGGKKYNCSLSYTESAALLEIYEDFIKAYGVDNASEILEKRSRLPSKFIPGETTTILFDETISVFYIFRGKSRSVVTPLDQEQYERMLKYWNNL